MIGRWFARLDPYLKVVVLCLIAFAVLMFLALVVLPADAAGSDGRQLPPGSLITIRARVTNVYCIGPCCCGYLTGSYQGGAYGASYCRWFRPLVEGELVTKTGRTNGNGYVR